MGIKLINIVKILLIVLFIVGVFWTLTTLVSAGFSYDDYTQKWTFCSMLNFSGVTCDLWWSGVAELPQAGTNITAEVNWTKVNENITLALNNYFNKTSIYENFYSKNQTYNSSEIDLKIATSNNTGFDLAYWTSDDRGTGEKLMTEYDVKKMLQDLEIIKNSLNPEGFPIWAIVLLCVIGFVAVFIAGPLIKQQLEAPKGKQPVVRELVPEISGVKRIMARDKFQTDEEKKEKEDAEAIKEKKEKHKKEEGLIDSSLPDEDEDDDDKEEDFEDDFEEEEKE